MHILDAHDAWNAKPVLVQARESGVQYFVEHHEGSLYIMANTCNEGEMGIGTADTSELPKR